MIKTNKINIILMVILALLITIGCTSKAEKSSSTSDKSSETSDKKDKKDDEDKKDEKDDEDEKDTDKADTKKKPDAPKPQIKTDNSFTKSIKFGGGKSGTEIEGSVIGNSKHTYTLGASSGQVMDLDITADHRAAFATVYDPSGAKIGDNSSGDIFLDQDGTYKIVVEGQTMVKDYPKGEGYILFVEIQ